MKPGDIHGTITPEQVWISSICDDPHWATALALVEAAGYTVKSDNALVDSFAETVLQFLLLHNWDVGDVRVECLVCVVEDVYLIGYIPIQQHS